MSNPLSILEPRIDPNTKRMDVGGLMIPPTSLVTALLYGFRHHDKPKAKEYYFWRLCDELWNSPELPEPLMVRHPWAEEMIRAVIKNKYVAIGGAANSGKSHTMAAWGILNWLAAPRDTLILLTSTTLREARKRIWGSIISLLSVIEGAPIRIRDSIGNASYVNEHGTLIERAGLSLIAAEKSRTREAVGKFIGIKQKRVMVIADELSEISEAILQAGLSNLSKNPEFQMIGMSNPNSRFDAFGVWSEPKSGWESIDTNTADEWITKWNGAYVRFDGERSPNVIAGEVIYPWLPTTEKLDEDKALLGPSSRGYMRMVRAVFFDSDEDESIYSESELAQSGSMSSVEWKGTPVECGGLDPAFTNGGDRTVLYHGRVGYDINNHFVFEFVDAVVFTDDATNKAVPRTYQICRQVVEACKKRNIQGVNLAVDSTGAGAPFCDVLSNEGDGFDQILRVSFGGKASDKRVSENSKLIGTELYINRVSELWWVGKELMRTKQIYGVNADLAKEVTGRNYEMVKGGTLRIKIESKVAFKARYGQSPDLADAAFLCLDLARQRHGLTAVSPPNDSAGKLQRRGKTIKSLSNILSTANSPLQ